MKQDTSEIRRRISRWHSTGDLGALWPDFTAVELQAAHHAIYAATRAILREPGATTTLEAATDRLAAALGIAAFASGMGPLLGWWVERGLIEPSPTARALLTMHLEHGRRRIEAIRQALRPILAALRSAGVNPTLLKGLHTGAVFFPEPGTRPAADIDLLVHPAERDAAAVGLDRAGLREVRRTVHGARSEWAPVGGPQVVRSLEFDHAENPWGVDLHTGLERWYFRGVRAGFGGEAFSHAASIGLDGNSVPVLGQPLLTGFLALHASLELARMRLVRLVELALVIRRDSRDGALDWGGLGKLLQRTGTTRFALPAFMLVERMCPGTVDAALLAGGQPLLTARLRRVIDAVERGAMAPMIHRSLDDRLMWARGARELLLNLSELAWPTDDGMPVNLWRLQWRRVLAFPRGTASLRTH